MTIRAKAPQALLEYLRNNDREDAVVSHAVQVKPSWWMKDGREMLPGVPLHTSDNGGQHSISRAQLFALADNAIADESGAGALALLWHTLAWGGGTKHRNHRHRIRSVIEHDDGPGQLRAAAKLSRKDPAGAFELLRGRRRNTFGWLGPNFFSKYLYFAGGGDPAHPCLIVDQFVRATLHEQTKDPRFAHVSQYSRPQYLETIEHLESWAVGAGDELGRPVAADEVERWAFTIAPES